MSGRCLVDGTVFLMVALMACLMAAHSAYGTAEHLGVRLVEKSAGSSVVLLAQMTAALLVQRMAAY
jgi:hypothetical protein